MGDIDMCREMSIELTLAIRDQVCKAFGKPRIYPYPFGFEVESFLPFDVMQEIYSEIVNRDEFSDVFCWRLESFVLPHGCFKYKISGKIHTGRYATKLRTI